YKGDCFLQKTWFRQARWYAMEDPNDAECGYSGFGSGNLDPNCTWYQHGMMIGLITECAVNTAMRNEVVGRDDSEEYVRYTFFPKCMEAGIGVIDFAVNYASEYLHEATQVNNGYNKILPDKIVYGYDENEPLRYEDKPNRAYHSDPHVSGSFIDGWRSINSGSYQDYAPVDGPITRISKFLEYPFLVQQFAINQIYVDERATQALDSGEVVMAESTTFLSDRVRKIESFGSQHMQSIIPGKTGVFGVDSMKALEWKVGIAAGKGGGFLLEAQDISLAKLIQKWFKDTFDSYSTENDIVDIIPDTPLLGQGIVGFYDPDYKEIGMSFMMEKGTGERILKTLVFDELLNSFKGEYTFVEPLYFNIGKKLYSCMYYLDDGFEYKVNNKIYRYNAEGVWNNFFGDTATAKISFIVNGLGEGKSNFAGVEKKFNAMMIEANYKSFSRIIYQTLYQSSTNTFVTASGEFWKNSEYLDQKWHIPIAVQTSADEVQFDTGSEMSGTYMLVTLEYNLDEELNIREIETDFTPLKS
ncbi:MAG: hypothetical protein H8E51_06945, partial [Bacteroidetes bacterium]|nr:hypothetical protein [Bacteroidota bacterium]